MDKLENLIKSTYQSQSITDCEISGLIMNDIYRIALSKAKNRLIYFSVLCLTSVLLTAVGFGILSFYISLYLSNFLILWSINTNLFSGIICVSAITIITVLILFEFFEVKNYTEIYHNTKKC